MTDKKRKTLVFGILVVAVIWGIWNNPFSSGKKESADAPRQVANHVAPVVKPAVVGPALAASFANLEDWRHDPFVRTERAAPRKTTAPAAAGPSFKLSVISRRGDNSMVIINGRVLRETDMIEGWKVVSIADNSVRLAKGSLTTKLTLKRR
ncbi:MAG: hypothetical protein KAT58_11600 [candidate division Zixibacteria bacterium]|nr:hypothetical protein [candidate division Zixibacteria bacterium]